MEGFAAKFTARTVDTVHTVDVVLCHMGIECSACARKKTRLRLHERLMMAKLTDYV